MKKYLWIILLVAVLVIGGIIYFYKSNSKPNSNYSAERSSLNNVSNTANSISNSADNTSNSTLGNTNANKTKKTVEKEIASFSTKITNKKDSNRQGNITITCSSLNNTIVKPGETFSFTSLVGKSTSDKGYKEANVINSEGDTIKGLGGGNCQVSSTLYNSVAQIPELEVIERHNHGAEVHYVPIGQDAAVAYGSMDFKFKNNLGSSIKLYASTDDKYITIRIAKIVE